MSLPISAANAPCPMDLALESEEDNHSSDESSDDSVDIIRPDPVEDIPDDDEGQDDDYEAPGEANTPPVNSRKRKWGQKSVSEPALKASYQVALRVAQTKQPYTIAESLILPAVSLMCKAMLGKDEEYEEKLRSIPLSDATIARRIDEMAADVRTQLVEKLLKADYFALQLDESTDVSDEAQLLAFVRFVDQDEMQEEFLFCKQLPGRATSSEIFRAIDDFFHEHHIPWPKCVALCTDGARATCGLKSGLIALVKDAAPQLMWTHCMLHRENLVAKDMSGELSNVMDTVVKVVHFVEKRASQTHLFSSLCDATGEEHTALLRHSGVRWLSRGAVLSRVFELRASLRGFFACHDSAELAECFSDDAWLTKLAYLSDLYRELNRLNGSSMQGRRDAHVNQLYDRMEGFLKKIRRWRGRVREGILSMFPSVEELCESAALSPHLTHTIVSHLEALDDEFGKYFSEAELWRKDKTWIQFPFKDGAADGSNLTVTEEDQLIDLSTDSTCRNAYETRPLVQFWISCQKDFPQLTAKAMRSLLPFATTHLCESGFSSLVYLKSEYSSRLKPEADLALCLKTSICPRIDQLCASH
ncbi:zinc finger BED domain-containing protein 5-like [Clupea harengus]|uniref:Zinc finger BED domain-containing protein 5-like n=1 Tax=Clupea harengus TaxID=7950 RepID=A0A8M1K692_CLUHA|nr:zinc finger BED domain-containing protein 5-like [Clupea harengus]